MSEQPAQPPKPASRSNRKWFIAISLLVHLQLFYALQAAALRPEKPKPKRVELAIIQPKPVEAPPPPPPPPPPEPKKVVDLTKKFEVVKDPKPTPPPEAAEPPPKSNEPPPPPMFGVSLSSTSADGGFKVAVGNTTMADPSTKVKPEEVKPLSGSGGNGRAPVSIAQVSKKPEKIGECPPFDPGSLYSREARDREIEGSVLLEVTIGADGAVVEVKVVKGLGFGLDDAAANTMRKHCKFQPAEVGDEKVPTKIRYNFNFVLPE